MYGFHDKQRVAEVVVAWLRTEGLVGAAIEQALAADLNQRAAQLISRMPLSQIHSNGRYLTYRRWVRAWMRGAGQRPHYPGASGQRRADVAWLPGRRSRILPAGDAAGGAAARQGCGLVGPG